MRTISKEEKSIQKKDETTNQILNSLNLPYKNFNNFYKVIDHSNQVDLRNSLYKNAVRYANIRSDWILADREERIQKEDERKSTHNVFIDSCNIMSRNMIKSDEDASWRRELGDDRKIIGDFACYICFVLGIKGR